MPSGDYTQLITFKYTCSALRELRTIQYIEMHSAPSPRELLTIHYIEMYSALRELQALYFNVINYW